MKGYKFLVIGGIIVVGVVAYELYKHFYISNDVSGKNEEVEKDDSSATKDTNFVSEPNDTTDKNIFTERETVVNSVKERHYEAAKAMEESLNNVFKESDEEIVTENSETLNKTSGDLEDLLK